MRYREVIDEDPVYDPSEMKKVGTSSFFFSEDTLSAEYIFIKQVNINNKEMYVFIHDQFERAVIGEMGYRSGDETPGLYIVAALTFKRQATLGPDVPLPKSDKTLQVDLVEVYESNEHAAVFKRAGLGYTLYSSLIDGGFTVISDTFQYRGGKALWVKMAKRADGDGFTVNVMDNGEFMVDDQDQLINYDGSNIPDDLIWSEDGAKKHVLLVARKK